MKCFLLPTLLVLFSTGMAHAQNKAINGNVTEKSTGEALIGVSVFVKDQVTTGTVTDLDGNFSLEIPATANVLVFRFIGYNELEVDLNGVQVEKPIKVEMEISSLNLDAVVISASRRQEKILDAPASISLINSEQINNTVALSPSDNLKGVPGVDVMNTGLVQTNVVTRGFNNIFSGALLTMVDNRYAAVPSLRVNVNMFIPTDNSDLERIEVLRGPASALYGPNCANGVLHMITKSPLDQEKKYKTTITLGGGFRSTIADTIAIANPVDPITGLVDTGYTPLFDDGDKFLYAATIRHSGKISEKFGYKILGTYFVGNDWLYDDPFEPTYIQKGYQTSEGRVTTDSVPTLNTRNNDINKMGIDARFDYRFNSETEIIFASGITENDGIEMTGIGAGQAINWRYYYSQLRFRHKNLFSQVFLNGSDAGDTYLFRTGDQIRDKSKQLAAQIQHSSDLMASDLTLIYGIDFIQTMPQTESTINGQYENSDNITEIGGYVQGKYIVNSNFELLGALRGDYHNFIDNPFISPRAAFVYKPSTKQTFRFTYNRAFSAPSSNNLNLDILQLADLGDLGAFGQSLFGLDYLPGIGVRATGNRGGFTYSFDENGLPMYLSPYASYIGDATNTYYSIGGNDQLNNITWDVATGLLFDGFAEATGLPLAQVELLFGPLLPDDISNIPNVLRLLNLTTEEFDLIDPSSVQDFGGILNSATNTFEIGWKGSLIDDKLFATLDVYRTTIQDFVGPLTNITPNVFLDDAALAAGITDDLLVAWNDPSNSLAVGLLTGALDANGDGDAFPEWVATVVGAGAGVPMGTVVPTELDQPAIYVTYVNLGDVTVYGADFGATIYINDQFRISAGYSWIDKDSIALEGAQLGYVALNAPRNKASLRINHDIPKLDLNVGATFRWQQAFPANSGAYVGTVESIHDMDLMLNYSPKFLENTVISALVSNVYNREQQYFVGAPVMGRTVFFKLSKTL